jgi:hypothetical protein
VIPTGKIGFITQLLAGAGTVRVTTSLYAAGTNNSRSLFYKTDVGDGTKQILIVRNVLSTNTIEVHATMKGYFLTP